MSDDGIEIRIRCWAHQRQRYRITIGDVTYEFPDGTTREQAEEAIEQAKDQYIRLLGLTPFKRGTP